MAKRKFGVYSATEAASYRSDVSALKKAGVIPRRVKLTSAAGLPQASFIDPKTGKRRFTKEIVEKFRLALPSNKSENKAKIVKVSESDAKNYRKLGYAVQDDKVAIPFSEHETVTVKADGKIVVKDLRNGIERVQIPISYHNLQQYFESIIDNKKEINRMKRANERFAFAINGHHSHRSFSTIEALVEYLSLYDSVEDSEDNPKAQRDFYSILEIVKGPKARTYDYVEKRPKKKRSKAETRSKQPEWKKEQYRAKRRVEEQKRRDKKKGKK